MEPRKCSVKRIRDWPDLEYLSDYGTSNNSTSTTNHKLPAKRIKKEVKSELSPLPSQPDTRINFCLAPGERVLECPYQRSHLILEQRWIRHLCKCRSNYLKESAAKGTPITIGICKWNAGHHVHFHDLRNHEAVCLDRRLELHDDIDSFTGPNPKTQDKDARKVEDPTTSDDEDLDADSPTKSSPQKTAPVKTEVKEMKEDWDSEPSTVTPCQPAYDPWKAILSKNIPFIPVPSGLTKHERCNYRLLQIARVQNGPIYNGDTKEPS